MAMRVSLFISFAFPSSHPQEDAAFPSPCQLMVIVKLVPHGWRLIGASLKSFCGGLEKRDGRRWG